MNGDRQSKLKLPADLLAFLESGRGLEYDEAACEAGRIALRRADDLRLRSFPAVTSGTTHEQSDPHRSDAGAYAVDGVDLIASCSGDYDSEGLLVWFPGEGRYGVWDSSHDLVLLFRVGVRWTNICESPARFINAQWGFDDLDRAETEFILPWDKYPWNS